MKSETGNRKRYNRTIVAFFVLFMAFSLLLPEPTFAVEDETLDDKKLGASADTMQDVLEGFGDDQQDIEKSNPAMIF